MALGGPHAREGAVTGEEIAEQELGGSKVHTESSGVGDVEVETDERVHRRRSSDYLSFFPPNCEEQPPRREPCRPDRPPRGGAARRPARHRRRKPYDMYKRDPPRSSTTATCFDIKPRWARTIITCLARIGGRPVGIVANKPRQLGRHPRRNDSADKAARFIRLCDAFGIPLVFLQDVPGFMVGTKVEHAGIIRHGAKMLYAVVARRCPSSPSWCERRTAPATT